MLLLYYRDKENHKVWISTQTNVVADAKKIYEYAVFLKEALFHG